MNLAYPYDQATNLYQLSDSDELSASMLSPELYARLRNLKQHCITQLTGISFTGDSAEVQRSMMLHAAVQGRIELLEQLLLDCDQAYSTTAV